jgi:hypothetical protein
MSSGFEATPNRWIVRWREDARNRSRRFASLDAAETFGQFLAGLLEERRPYLTAGSTVDYETHGRKRLLPAFGSKEHNGQLEMSFVQHAVLRTEEAIVAASRSTAR